MTTIIRKAGGWEFIKDSFMGVTAFYNSELNIQSNWNTGNDAVEEIVKVEKMTDSEFKEYADKSIQ